MNRIKLHFAIGLLFILVIQNGNAQTARTVDSGTNLVGPCSVPVTPNNLDSLTWNGSQSTSWIDPLNWTPADVPDEHKVIFMDQVQKLWSRKK